MKEILWLLAVPLAYLVDIVIGDPNFITHPVVIIGKGISALEKVFTKGQNSPKWLKITGVLLMLIIVLTSSFVTWGLVRALSIINPWLGLGGAIWLISTTIAGKSLKKAAKEIYDLLAQDNISGARVKVGYIVGRDTEKLDTGEVTRATVETVAENIVDGIISPLFYAFLGGAPLAMAYRAANTLDSMVGYKNEKYKDFGWASARFDDILNYIPARITALLITLAAVIYRFPVKRVVSTILRDAPKHPSPNSGYPEAGVAGALGVRLGGLNYYGGIASLRANMGDSIKPLEAQDIIKTNSIAGLTGFLGVILGTVLGYLILAI